MRNLVIAITLSFVSSAALANSFNPWDNRGVDQAHHQAQSFNKTVSSTGFAPWGKRENKAIFAGEKGIASQIIEPNIFRPWS